MTDCERLRALIRDGLDLPPTLEDHASRCEACADLLVSDPELVGALEPLSPTPHDGPETSAMVEVLRTNLRNERGVRAWCRSRPTRARLLAVLLALLAIGLLHGGGLLRPDASVYPLRRFALELIALGVAGAMATLVALWPQSVRRPSGVATGAVVTAAALIPLVSAALSPAHTEHAASLAGAGDDLWSRAAGCFVYGSLFSLPVAGVAWLVDRGPLANAVPIAGAATVAANVALWLHCPITHGIHIAIGHATIGAVAILLATGWRRRARRGATPVSRPD